MPAFGPDTLSASSQAWASALAIRLIPISEPSTASDFGFDAFSGRMIAGNSRRLPHKPLNSVLMSFLQISCCKTRRFAEAFTLAELLVSLAIIAILCALLLPMLIQGRGVTRDVTCASNLRSVGIAWQMYADANNRNLGAAGPHSSYYINGDPAYTRVSGSSVFTYYLDSGGNPITAAPWYIALCGGGFVPPKSLACPADEVKSCNVPTDSGPVTIGANLVGDTVTAMPLVAGAMKTLVDSTVAVDSTETWMSLRRIVPLSYAANYCMSWSNATESSSLPPFFYAPERSQTDAIEARTPPSRFFIATDFGNSPISAFGPDPNSNPINFGRYYTTLGNLRYQGQWQQSNRHGAAGNYAPGSNGGHNFLFLDGHAGFVPPMPGESNLTWMGASASAVNNDTYKIVNYYTQQANTRQQPGGNDGILPNGTSLPAGTPAYSKTEHMGYIKKWN